MEQAFPSDSVGEVRLSSNSGCSPTMHLLPCCITHNGPAPISSFFQPRNTDLDADGVMAKTAAFRGRKLLGCTSEFPQHFTGFVLEKDMKRNADCKEDQYDVWNTQGLFKDITYWNHDTAPSSADSVRRCLEWLSISSAIHGPVSVNEVDAMLQEQVITADKGKKRKDN